MKIPLRRNFLILALYFFCLHLNAQTKNFVGRGESEQSPEEARKQALSELSGTLKSDVRSEFKSFTDLQGSDASQVLSITTDLPLMGVDFKEQKDLRRHIAEALMDPERARPLYAEHVLNLRREIEQALESLATVGSASEKEAALKLIVTNLEELTRHRTVALLLGEPASALPLPGITKAEAAIQLEAVSKVIDSVERAAQTLCRDIPFEDIYIYPAKARGSGIPTQFAAVLRENMATVLNAVATPGEARYLMQGRYDYSDKGLDVFYYLRDGQNKTILSRNVRLMPEAYKEYAYEVKENSFESLLQLGHVVSSTFAAALRTEHGTEDLVYYEDDPVRILVKLSKPGFYYIVGHTLHGDERYSYLLPVNERGPGDAFFIKYVSPEEAGKWVQLAEFEVIPPLGIESLQLIASTRRPEQLPPYLIQEPDWGGNVLLDESFIAGMATPAKASVEKALVQTRALGRRKKAEEEKAEATLVFSTMPKDVE
jgi:hypothetical protein